MVGGVAVEALGWGWRHAGRRAWAVRDLDLRIDPGERVLLLGASGSGKSTLLSGLSGLLHGQDSGEAAGVLCLDGRPAHEVRHRSGLLLQDPDSQLVMTRAGDDVAFGPENHGVPRPEIWRRVDAALSAVGFGYDRDRATAALSGGEKQRLALAGLLANDPGLVLLDEPTANLDPEGALQVRDAVGRAVAATGATLVVVEHRVRQWLPIIDRVIVLGPDGVLADGAPGPTFDRYADPLRAAGVWLPDAPPPALRRGRPDGSVVLSAEELSYRYRGAVTDAVDDVSLAVAAGTLSAVTGPNGSGKSTLAMLLAGLTKPAHGQVRASDSPIPLHRRRSRSLVRAVGTVFQQPEHQFVGRTVRAELAQAPRRIGWSDPQITTRVDELLDRLGLSALAEANPFTLSGGQQRRLSVATALAVAPPVLVLDEPTFGQDARTWRELVALLDEVRAKGTGLVVVSHDLEFVAALADRVVTLRSGHLAEHSDAAAAEALTR